VNAAACRVIWAKSLADPLKPYNPAFLCKPPIFSDCFTHRRRFSDAIMGPLMSFFYNGKLRPPDRGGGRSGFSLTEMG